ncbi:hypothetical protein [Streptomyces phaeochromogenes]
MSERIGLYPRVRVEGGSSGTVSQAGAVLLVEAVSHPRVVNPACSRQ